MTEQAVQLLKKMVAEFDKSESVRLILCFILDTKTQ